ncbi:MAG: hypothetical protein KC474_10880 [Cyanobacteria bacterium HKST-UBA04]|nr:hypothetical protein [Cyanobacteria bacterium HKST-UBA04]MCA9841295.1 hypothetical protein [Cyanobacteria bacterium HKST-UBA03]
MMVYVTALPAARFGLIESRRFYGPPDKPEQETIWAEGHFSRRGAEDPRDRFDPYYRANDPTEFSANRNRFTATARYADQHDRFEATFHLPHHLDILVGMDGDIRPGAPIAARHPKVRPSDGSEHLPVDQGALLQETARLKNLLDGDIARKLSEARHW